jgi:hypothetical protein
MRERRRLPRPAADSGRAPYSMLLGLSVFLLVGALSFRQLSSPAVATQLIAEGIAALTEVDVVIAEHKAALDEAAITAASDEPLGLPGYPLPVRFTRAEVLELPPPEFRELLLARSAAVVYADGLEAFGQDGRSLSLFSSEGLLDRLVGTLSESNHERAGFAAAFLGVLTAIAAVMVVVRSSGFSWIRALGFPLLLASVAGLVAFGGILALALGRWWGGDPFSDEVDRIIGDAIGIVRRNYAIVGALGLGLVVVGLLFELAARFLPGREREIRIGDEFP